MKPSPKFPNTYKKLVLFLLDEEVVVVVPCPLASQDFLFPQVPQVAPENKVSVFQCVYPPLTPKLYLASLF